MQPLVIDAAGDDLAIGRAHAAGSMGMRPALAQFAAATRATYPPTDPSVRERVQEVREAWAELTPGTLAQIDGMAQVYQIPSDDLLTTVLGTYLRSGDRAAVRPSDGCFGRPSSGPADLPSDGCTTVALTGEHPLLAKNRDNDPRYLDLQTVLRVRPDQGYRWLALSTAGAPGVHSSGMNEVGLSVADTHVASSDIGPGMPRFASMMHVLQECRTTAEALDRILTTPQMGLGTITVVDEHGEAAVVECGFRTTTVAGAAAPAGSAPPSTREPADQRSPGAGVVATNHYTDAVLSSCGLGPEDGTPAVSSQARRAAADRLLSQGPVDAADVRALLSSHLDFDGEHGAEGSVCQHGPSLRSETISTVIFDPAARHLDLCLGRPCRASFHRIPVLGPAA